MKRMLSTPLLVGLAVAGGCSNCIDTTKVESARVDAPGASASKPMSPAATRDVLGLPAGWELVPRALYAAGQSAGNVTITAKGQHNTGGLETRLFASPLRIDPPQWMLARKPPPPDAMVTQAITPFEATASFKADGPVAAVRVSDAAGLHEVKVEQGG